MEKIIPKLVPMSPYEMYTQRVKATYEGIRKTREGLSYTPAQFGGLFGQRDVANGAAVLELTDYEIS